MANEDWPITGVVVVADITKCPAGYTTVRPDAIFIVSFLLLKVFLKKFRIYKYLWNKTVLNAAYQINGWIHNC